MKVKGRILWGALWYSKNRLDGVSCHIINENCLPMLFATRRKARKWLNEKYGYIKTRKDLRGKDYGWRFPRIVRLKISLHKPSKRAKGSK
jgi:hypothetical protein